MLGAAPLSGVPLGSREKSQTERPLRRSTPPPHHTMCRALSESRSASVRWYSAPPRSWGRWRSFCSSQKNQEQGGASWVWVAPGSVEVLDPRAKEKKEEGTVREFPGLLPSHLEFPQMRWHQLKSRTLILRGIKTNPTSIGQDTPVSIWRPFPFVLWSHVLVCILSLSVWVIQIYSILCILFFNGICKLMGQHFLTACVHSKAWCPVCVLLKIVCSWRRALVPLNGSRHIRVWPEWRQNRSDSREIRCRQDRATQQKQYIKNVKKPKR